jgi:hypothetical protein
MSGLGRTENVPIPGLPWGDNPKPRKTTRGLGMSAFESLTMQNLSLTRVKMLVFLAYADRRVGFGSVRRRVAARRVHRQTDVI